jgi:hypothetical protein
VSASFRVGRHSFRPRLEKDRDVRLRTATFRDTQQQVDEIVVGRPHVDAIQTQKSQATRETDACVPVDEGVILHQMEEIAVRTRLAAWPVSPARTPAPRRGDAGVRPVPPGANRDRRESTMVLVDMSVWIDHFRRGAPVLADLLHDGRVACHPAVVGELACGVMRQRDTTLDLLRHLPSAAARPTPTVRTRARLDRRAPSRRRGREWPSTLDDRPPARAGGPEASTRVRPLNSGCAPELERTPAAQRSENAARALSETMPRTTRISIRRLAPRPVPLHHPYPCSFS